MPGLVPGIHVFAYPRSKNVDGRDKSGHDEVGMSEAHPRHCEERSDEAIQPGALSWIASLRSQ